MFLFQKAHKTSAHITRILSYSIVCVIVCFILQSCQHAKQPAQTKPLNNEWSKQWSYQNTTWYKPISNWLNESQDPMPTHHARASSAHRHWQSAVKAILHACEMNTLPDWLDQQLLFYLPDKTLALPNKTLAQSDNDMPVKLTSLHYDGTETTINLSEHRINTTKPQVIYLAHLDLNDDCAAIASLIAFNRYQHPFMLDLSHNLISNRGAAYIHQIITTFLAKMSSNIEINLRDNSQLGPIGKHYTKTLAENHNNIRIHLDQETTDSQKEAFARALALDNNPIPNTSTYTINSYQNFSHGTKGIKQMTKLLAGYPLLQEIHLINHRIPGQLDWAAAVALAEIIRPYKKLTTLTILNQPIGDRGLKALITSLNGNHPDFYLLNLTGTGITDTGLTNLVSWEIQNPLILIIS